MRRALSISTATLVLVAMLAPAMFADVNMNAGHACCHHAMAQHERCASAPKASFDAHQACQSCPFCQSLTTSARVLPAPSAIFGFPQQEHPVLDEFFPAAPDASQLSTRTPRAPPTEASR